MRLRAILGGQQGGDAGPCENHKDMNADFRVACPGPGPTRIWLLCFGCAEDMVKNIDGVIIAPAGRKQRGRKRG